MARYSWKKIVMDVAPQLSAGREVRVPTTLNNHICLRQAAKSLGFHARKEGDFTYLSKSDHRLVPHLVIEDGVVANQLSMLPDTPKAQRVWKPWPAMPEKFDRYSDIYAVRAFAAHRASTTYTRPSRISGKVYQHSPENFLKNAKYACEDVHGFMVRATPEKTLHEPLFTTALAAFEQAYESDEFEALADQLVFLWPRLLATKDENGVVCLPTSLAFPEDFMTREAVSMDADVAREVMLHCLVMAKKEDKLTPDEDVRLSRRGMLSANGING